MPAGTYTVEVQKGSFTTEFSVDVTAGQTLQLAEEECLQADDVSIAVVTGQYDSIEKVLDRLGFQYILINGKTGTKHVSLMRTPSELAKYDIIFFNCGMNESWTQSESEIAQNIRDYVANGGSVYTSDWSYYLAEVAYPGMADFYGDDRMSGSAYVGVSGTTSATIQDANMVAALGSNTASINYDLDSWASVESVGTGTALMTGTYHYLDWMSWKQGQKTGPLAIRQQDGAGQILFTTFHNEQQTTFDMDVLLEEIILSL